MRLSRISAVFFDSQPNFSRNFNLRKNAANPNISRIFLQPAEFKKKMRLRGLLNCDANIDISIDVDVHKNNKTCDNKDMVTRTIDKYIGSRTIDKIIIKLF